MSRFVDEFNKVAERAHRCARSHGFWSDGVLRPFAEQIALMHSELSEALEADRKALVDDHLPNYSGVEAELADCVIRIMDTSHALSMDVAGAIEAKIAYNEGRAFKHGKRY